MTDSVTPPGTEDLSASPTVPVHFSGTDDLSTSPTSTVMIVMTVFFSVLGTDSLSPSSDEVIHVGMLGVTSLADSVTSPIAGDDGCDASFMWRATGIGRLSSLFCLMGLTTILIGSCENSSGDAGPCT